ncbi:MAG: 50S ribosomal protein L25, partial [Acidobacteriota bacterium]
GVKEGGVLEVILREITVECLPADVPGHIQVDVSHLEVNANLHVSELVVDRDKIEIQNDPGIVVLLVAPPTVVVEEVEEAEVELLEGEEAAEPEVIGKGKEDEEEV